jgi:hypothetical protein
VNIVQNYAEAVYYWHNSTGIYAGRTGERGVNLPTIAAKQPEVTRRSHASSRNDYPQSRAIPGCDMMEREHGASRRSD